MKHAGRLRPLSHEPEKTMKATQTLTAINVLAVGVGGQGIITLTNVLAEAAFQAGYDVKQSEIHGLSQRGGSVSGQVRWGRKVYTPVVMEGEAHFLVALEELEALRNVHRLRPDGLVLVNQYQLLPGTVTSGQAEYPDDIYEQLAPYGRVCKVPANAIAQELGNVRMANVVMLGALSRQLEFPETIWPEIVRQSCPAKFVDQNLQAFTRGREQG
jgi:indolepyruvate ferredoxin oxidoreductase, beta subunit